MLKATTDNKISLDHAASNAREFTALGGLLLAALTVLSGCSYAALTPLTKVQAVAAGFGLVDAHLCTSVPSPGQQNIKYVFILDHSGSNQPGFPNPLTPGDVSDTDPQGSRRYGPLVNFVQSIVPTPDTATSFALIDFNDTATQPGTLSGFDSSSSDFITNVQNDWVGGGTDAAPAPHDSGFTNYQAALQLAQQLITKDIQAQAVDPNQVGFTSSYVIVFVSDGVPTIADSSASGGVYTQTFSADIDPVIASVMNLKNDPTYGPLISNITLNTAYYSNGTQLVAAQTLLTQMANAGNGQFMEFDSGQNILYQQFAPPSRAITNSLVDVFVENQNMVWWDDGRLLADSDGDGLPDVIEAQIGSNPYKADSDGNGVSDLVEYRTKGTACNDPACAASGRDSYAMCDGFSPVTAADGSITFTSSTNDGLNDCEKFVLGASRASFNSNGDMIPDQLAFRSGLPIDAGTSAAAFLDPFNDGINNYNKIKAGLPLKVSMKTLGSFPQQYTQLTPEASSVAGTSCYHAVVGGIAISNVINTFKMMVVQNSSALQDKPFLMTATAVLPSGANSASFQPADFK
jgi:hypothetical protein